MAVLESSEAVQLLTFSLDDQQFALEISKVREILDNTNITKVPRMPDYMKGVINLRGNAVPVIDMRLKLGMPATDITVNTCIIILEINMGTEILILGAMTDSVQEVFEMDPKDVEPAPSMGARLNTDIIVGMGKKESNDKFIIILDIDKIFNDDDLSLFLNSSEKAADECPVETERELVNV